MDKALKEKLIAALRSGNYQQGTGYLRDSQDRFCCLGVLHEVMGGEWDRVPTDTVCYTVKGTTLGSLLPNIILQTAGLNENDAYCLVGMNDGGWKFDDIADSIERDSLEEDYMKWYLHLDTGV